MTEQKKVALVTGGNRGMGFALCRALGKLGYAVILSSRDAMKGIKKAAELEEEGIDVVHSQLDVTDPDSIVSIYKTVIDTWGRLDVLINNAGILPDATEGKSKHPSGLFHTDKSLLIKSFETNAAGPFQLCDVFVPLMCSKGYGRVVNVTSGLSQLSTMQGGYPAYRLSKTALNAVTRIFAAQGLKKNVLVNSVDPGWVRTDMGGGAAKKSAEEGIDTIVWAATLPDNSLTGMIFRNREPIDW